MYLKESFGNDDYSNLGRCDPNSHSCSTRYSGTECLQALNKNLYCLEELPLPVYNENNGETEAYSSKKCKMYNRSRTCIIYRTGSSGVLPKGNYRRSYAGSKDKEEEREDCSSW